MKIIFCIEEKLIFVCMQHQSIIPPKKKKSGAKINYLERVLYCFMQADAMHNLVY